MGTDGPTRSPQLIADIVIVVFSPTLSPVHWHEPLGSQDDGQEAAEPPLATLSL